MSSSCGSRTRRWNGEVLQSLPTTLAAHLELPDEIRPLEVRVLGLRSQL